MNVFCTCHSITVPLPHRTSSCGQLQMYSTYVPARKWRRRWKWGIKNTHRLPYLNILSISKWLSCSGLQSFDFDSPLKNTKWLRQDVQAQPDNITSDQTWPDQTRPGRYPPMHHPIVRKWRSNKKTNGNRLCKLYLAHWVVYFEGHSLSAALSKFPRTPCPQCVCLSRQFYRARFA